jgi:multiple RNA-binding domain-containing protein 1
MRIISVRCLKYFHDTFIDTSKITCEIARPKGDESLARPWSRYSVGSSANQRLAAKDQNKPELANRPEKGAAKNGTGAKEKKIASKDHELLERAKTDPKMKAFIDAFKPRTKTKVWENDDAALNDTNAAAAFKEMTQVPVKSRKAGGEGIVHTRTHVKFDDDGSSDEEYQDLTAGKKSGSTGDDEDMDVDGGVQGAGKAFDDQLDDMGYLKTKASVWEDSEDEAKEGEEEEEEEEEEEQESKEKHERAKEGEKGVAQKKRNVGGGKVNFDDLSDPSENEDADEEMGEGEVGGVEATREAATRDAGGRGEEEEEDEDGRLFITNLPYGTNEEELTAFFKRFGELSEVHMCIDKATKRPTGFAFILFLHPADAEAARQATDERFYQGMCC